MEREEEEREEREGERERYRGENKREREREDYRENSINTHHIRDGAWWLFCALDTEEGSVIICQRININDPGRPQKDS